ncbi:MAG: type IV pilus assembly protein PilM [bacterium]|nr:type IV pilus assembly protein PilM [bacterium]
MFGSLNLKPEVFGLDISDLSLKIVKLKKIGSSFGLVSFGEVDIKPGIIKGGEIKDEKELAEAIKGALKSVEGEKIKTRYIVASLPEEKAYLQIIQVPKMAADDLKSAIVFEAENYIPLPIDQVYLDYEVISPIVDHLNHFDVLLAALPRKTVDPYLNSFKSAGLIPKALEIESLAIGRALIKNGLAQRPTLLIDLGATRTSFIVYAGRSIRFTSSIPVSGTHFTQIIAKALEIKHEEAEELKLKYGLEEKIKLKLETKEGGQELEKERGKIFESLVPALVDLVQQIKKCTDYYQTHASHLHLLPGDNEISKILLCGGGANLKGLPELLSLELKIPVEIGNSRINILQEDDDKRAPYLPPDKSLGYTTAFGLAMRGIKEK